MRQPTRPTHLSEHAERTLQALAEERAEAESLRTWFTMEFLNALLD